MKTESELIAAYETLKAMSRVAKDLGLKDELAFMSAANALGWALTGNSTYQKTLDDLQEWLGQGKTADAINACGENVTKGGE